MHSDMDGLRRWIGVRSTRQRIFQILHRHHTSHVATDVAVVGTVGAAAGIRARYAGVDRYGYQTVSYRDAISSGGNTSWVHAGKDCRGWWKGILHSCRFGLSPIGDGHTNCSWGNLLSLVHASAFSFSHLFWS